MSYTNYGFTAHVTGVVNENGDSSIGIKYEDSDGIKFDTNKSGKDFNKVLQDLYTDAITKICGMLTKQEELRKKEEEAAKDNEHIAELTSQLDALDKQRKELNDKIETLRGTKKDVKTGIDKDVDDFEKLFSFLF
jgi:predicted  nucleic acid-binding Zn-ribbon protein